MNARTDRIREACWFADRLLTGRHYRAVMGMSTTAMEVEGEEPELLVRRARALMALHRDAEARHDLVRACVIGAWPARSGCVGRP